MIFQIKTVFLAGICLAGLTGIAAAHARLTGSSPPADASLQASPATLSLTFSEGLESAFSHLTLMTQQGQAVQLEKENVDGTGGSQLSASPAMTLPAGSYVLKWQVLSTDGHKTSGSLMFSVTP